MSTPRLKAIPGSAAPPPHGTSERQARPLEDAIHLAARTIECEQQPDGHWIYELEADCTIPAEYILMMHFMDEVDEPLEGRLASYLRSKQAGHGGWPLYHGGEFDLSCSVKAYYALKLAGDDPQAEHMRRAREAILAAGGAAHSNVFTRITLALFRQVPWRAVPFIPAEVILLPRWFPFHIDKVSYWSRTVMVPLFVLCTLKPAAANPRNVDIRELFVTPPEHERHYFQTKGLLNRAFLLLDHLGRLAEKLVPRRVRKYAIDRCARWFIARLNGEDGLGGIFPAMVNAYEALALLGYPADHPYRVQTRKALQGLLVDRGQEAYCQPCVSPVWDTALACHALYEAHGGEPAPAVERGLQWLAERQLDDEPGDWQWNHPGVRGGGWAFQYNNPWYPDLDDTSVVGWAMHKHDRLRYQRAIERAAQWVAAMRSRDGGFAAFDSDNTHFYLNAIPFADHGALLDPPTGDLTARCLLLLSLADPVRYRDEIEAAIAWLKRDQEPDGSWFGRWGTNYIYGTWSALTALEVAGVSPDEPWIRKAMTWLHRRQNADGGWGESNASYYPGREREPFRSTPFQTAWALLALFAGGDLHSEAVHRGVHYLLATQGDDGLWHDEEFTAPGFPRVFYLRYHGYARYFPLWALAEYRNRLAAQGARPLELARG